MPKQLPALLVMCLLFASIAASAADPSFYVRRSTWEETMRASREALMQQEAQRKAALEARVAADPALGRFAPLEEAVNFGDEPRLVRVRVAGLKELYVGAVSLGGKRTVGQYCEPRLIDANGKATRVALSKPPVVATHGPGTFLPSSHRSWQTVSVDGQELQRGFVVDRGEVALQLDGKYEWFEAWIAAIKGPKTEQVRFTADYRSRYRLANRGNADRSRLWELVQRDFGAAELKQGRAIEDPHGIWQRDWRPGDIRSLAARYARVCLGDIKRQAEDLAKKAQTPADLEKVIELYRTSNQFAETLADMDGLDVEAVRLAVEDLSEAFPDRYDRGPEVLAVLQRFDKNRQRLRDAVEAGDRRALEEVNHTLTLTREALLANPLLDIDELLVVKRVFGPDARKVMSSRLGLPSLNSRTHDTIPHYGWDNEIARLTDLRGAAQLSTLYRPREDMILSDVDLHFDADRLMFSSIGANDRWAIFEMKADGSGVKQITPTDLPDVDFFDSCYLPCGDVAVTSTASYQGLPCENGKRPMASLYRLDPQTQQIRQLTFEQDSDWCPTVLNNGRLMYLRWEYTDTPHYFTRILFHCNPDGTAQMEYYGSNSYFPNAFFYARPIPGHPTMVVGVASGHHGISRSGRLLLIDPAEGRHEADGVVQEIPGRGKPVEPIIRDRLVDGVWPQFLNPYPLSEKYYLIAAKPGPDALWGIYLVDVFDNMTLIKEVPGAALLEPLPFRPTETPPVIPDKVDLNSRESIVFLTDVYTGPGLKDIPRGEVKNLRLLSYHYAYNGSGGHASVGVESSWDVKRILGTVPVEEDGSAMFRIPANTPVALQPLDEEGRALQLMRSWLVGMPGETVSCVGCHEQQNDVVQNRFQSAGRRAASRITPWYGDARPFGFHHEVQPVLDKYCVGCHNGQPRDDRKQIPDLTVEGPAESYSKAKSYMALQAYVRRPGPESDYHLTEPMEYHADTSELIQMLKKGHHNVQLDEEAWQRLYTWIDFNVPYRGKWGSNPWRGQDQAQRRLELAKRYANVDVDPECEYDQVAAELASREPIEPIRPEPLPARDAQVPKVAGWPFAADEAVRRQQATGGPTRQTIELAEGVTLDLVLIPAGQFAMGSPDGPLDEYPMAEVQVDRPFWIGTCEITNAQFALFDAEHDSRYIDASGKDHSSRGHPVNRPEQPVVRVTWQRAMDFCRWLSEKTGRSFGLPTEGQWEWACRAGSETPLWYGSIGDDFSPFANLADGAIRGGGKGGINPFPRIKGIADGQDVPTKLAAYRPNPWGLFDMHGSVAEWTRSAYRPYPYDPGDGRNAADASGQRTARGGSWRDRPHRATSAFRLGYQPYQRVFNVGFRVVREID